MKRQASSTHLARGRSGLVRRAISPALRTPMLAAVLALAGSALASTPASAFVEFDPRITSATCYLQGKEYRVGARVRVSEKTGRVLIGTCEQDTETGRTEWSWFPEQTEA